MATFASASEPASDEIPLEERIRVRAYYLFQQRGEQHGSAMDDWLQAEAEILAEGQETKV
jgi:Protein of unknown function (DUF2934)